MHTPTSLPSDSTPFIAAAVAERKAVPAISDATEAGIGDAGIPSTATAMNTAPQKRRISRRAFLYGCAAVTGAAAYPILGEAHWLEVTRTPLKLTRVPLSKPIRVLHMSDFHASAPVPMELIRRAVALGLKEKPDLILLTGDYITYRFHDWDEYVEALAPLARFAPTLAVKGNHDGGPFTIPAEGDAGDEDSLIDRFLHKAGVELLSNQARIVNIHGQEINIVGIGDYWSKKSRPKDAFAHFTPAELAQRPTIVMAHNPDTKDVCQAYTWDLMLCGHTHGGQILLPFMPPLRLPVKDRRYYAGLKPFDGRHLYITRGVGSLWGVRLNCRPEVTILDLA